MNYINFSKSYHVRMLTERDIPLILALCEKNTQFYEHCPPFVTAESIRDDMCALPQRKMDEPQDKYYLGYFDDAQQLVAVMDFIDHYPTERSCFIGFFMMERSVQGHGIGSRIITELCVYLHSLGYEYIRLGYVDGNKQSESFWKKNQFTEYRIEKSHTGLYGRCNETGCCNRSNRSITEKTCVKNAKYTVIVKQAAGAQIEPRRP